MKILVQLLRVFVGLTFVFSGFVKLIDPLGSAYKFEEYFSEGVLNMEFLIPYALPFSIVLITVEFLLGINLLAGWKSKFTTWSLLGIMLVFLFLTWYSAYFDKVTDCGCFGDAVKLSTWGTFYKNVVLVLMVLILVWKHEYILPILKRESWMGWIPFSGLVFCLLITYHVLLHLPIIDFRPYAIGKNIAQGMETYDEDGVPLVHDFSLESPNEDLTEELLSADKVVLFISYDLSISDENGFVASKVLADEALEKGYRVYGVSADSDAALAKIKERFNLPYDFLFCDATTLKTIVRSNPGIVILNRGTVSQKKAWRDYQEIEL